MTDASSGSSLELQTQLAQVARAFRPGAPVDTQDLFAGRTAQMNELIQGVAEPYMHVLVFGERGVGKTSLVTVVGTVLPQIAKAAGSSVSVNVIRENCAESDSFESIWRRALGRCLAVQRKPGLGFNTDPSVRQTSMATCLPSSVGPGDVLNVLRGCRQTVFIFDEFDRVSARGVANAMADLLKGLSDHHVNATVVLVGVGDNVTEIMSAHRSVERCTRQIHMPRMTNVELLEIIEKGAKICSMKFSDRAAGIIVNLARGFPHYAHLLASAAANTAALRRSADIRFEHLTVSLDKALARSFRSLTDSYLQATQSPRPQAMHTKILLACALSGTDEQGYFRPSSLCETVTKILGRRATTSTFNPHLTEFTMEKRGCILKRTGSPRNYRYRFINPLMIPYVLVQGLQAGDISSDDLGLADTFSG